MQVTYNACITIAMVPETSQQFSVGTDNRKDSKICPGLALYGVDPIPLRYF